MPSDLPPLTRAERLARIADALHRIPLLAGMVMAMTDRGDLRVEANDAIEEMTDAMGLVRSLHGEETTNAVR